jgi:muramoyltetrapeptide carboxypeptidase
MKTKLTLTATAVAYLLFFTGSSTTAVEPIFAPALKPGDTVMIVAPAGPVTSPDDIERAKQRLEAMGFRVRLGHDLYRSEGYLAGPDDVRVAELNAAFRDPNIQAVIPARGGYGLTRIVDRVDYDAIRKNPKVLLGFSDITVLHLAISQQTGLVTFHSPNAMWGIGEEDGMPRIAKHFLWRALLAKEYGGQAGYRIAALGWADDFGADELLATCDLEPPVTLHAGKARGRLTGGNLSLVAALMGTPYEIETDGKILFLEDVGEAPYRVDRMLSTLRLAGKLDGLAGVVLGQFTRRSNEDQEEEETTMDDVLQFYFESLGVPTIKNFPLGHIQCNVTIPVGALCEINADDQTLTLLENPVKLAP